MSLSTLGLADNAILFQVAGLRCKTIKCMLFFFFTLLLVFLWQCDSATHRAGIYIAALMLG